MNTPLKEWILFILLEKTEILHLTEMTYSIQFLLQKNEMNTPLFIFDYYCFFTIIIWLSDWHINGWV